MSIIGWIILGLVAGFIASFIVNRSGEGLFMDIVLGIVGALVGGFAFNLIGKVGVTGFNVWSLFVAIVGAVLVLVVYHLFSGRGQHIA
ncbi:MAG: GlsB/YeaQ/YmgE family stress response membrane protein [Deltaproteobacteria bacterium]